MMIKRIYFIKIAACFLTLSLLYCFKTFSQAPLLLPSPQQIVKIEGGFQMNEFIPVFLHKNAPIEEQQAVWTLCEGFENIFGKTLPVTHKEKGRIIVLRNLSTETVSKNHDKLILPVGDEGYQLNISPEKIEIIANNNTGLFYGTQTLLQLFKTSSLTGYIDCITINDIPSSNQRFLQYNWDAANIPSSNFIKYLAQLISHYKYNGIVFFNDSISSPFPEMELFYLKKFTSSYHIDIITDAKELPSSYSCNIDLKNTIYPEFHSLAKTLFCSLQTIENDSKIINFSNHGAPLFIDCWYSLLWGAELLWNHPKDNSPDTFYKRTAQYAKVLDRQFFNIDFPLTEKLQAFDSLQIISLTEQDFWQPVKLENASSKYRPANNKFVLERAYALEEMLRFFLENTAITNEEALYSMIFAIQRTEFIALKHLLQESLLQEKIPQKAINEAVDVLTENIYHLKQAHEEIWKIENDINFPKNIAEKYNNMIRELEDIKQ